MTGAQPDPGWWQCEGCGGDVRPKNATKEWVDGGKGNQELLAFCPDCSQ